MNLARAQNSGPDLNVIRDDNGKVLTEPELEQHVTGFYKNLYALPRENLNVTQDHLHNFLGPVADAEPVVQSKLNIAEKNELENPLSIRELDKALKQCNKKSAAGTDGINNKFIAHFWPYFRTPLFNYANCCFEKGELTPIFRTAKIRLIPKKGDLKKIGNWRPISLLNCFYKLLSRVFTNRLKKIMDKVTGIGQYGYSKKKQCQEVLIGLLDKIFKAKNGDTKGVLLSLDIKKAFDSISHSYMEQVLKFFNFGENIIRWIKVLCTNREACIILPKNKLGKNFKLKRGNAQGDTISPFLFNICYQLLLFKLEYDLQIKNLSVSESVPESPIYSTNKPVSTYAKKVYTFADDCNVICNADPTSLNRVKVVLSDFEKLSGLECNLEKTNALCIGTLDPVGAGIVEHGFQVKTNLKILGMTVSNDFETDLSTNGRCISRKISENIMKWERYNLSMPGRIQIAKTMLYSQMNYLGSFLEFEETLYEDWENQIFRFVAGNLKVGKKEYFSKSNLGA
jgi:hypothetical protein